MDEVLFWSMWAIAAVAMLGALVGLPAAFVWSLVRALPEPRAVSAAVAVVALVAGLALVRVRDWIFTRLPHRWSRRIETGVHLAAGVVMVTAVVGAARSPQNLLITPSASDYGWVLVFVGAAVLLSALDRYLRGRSRHE